MNGITLPPGCYLDGDRVIRPEHEDWDKGKAIEAGAFTEKKPAEVVALVPEEKETEIAESEDPEIDLVEHGFNMITAMAQTIQKQKKKNPISRKRILGIEKQASTAMSVIHSLFTDDGETAERIAEEAKTKVDKHLGKTGG